MKDNSPIITFIIVTIIFILLLVAFIVLILFLYQRRHLAYKKNLESVKAEYENTILSVELEMKEEVLQDISKEVHDNIGFHITMAKTTIHRIDMKGISPDISEKINQSIGFMDSAMKSVEHLSATMHTDSIKNLGLLTTVTEELQKIDSSGVIKTNLKIMGKTRFLPEQTELIIYRVIQEALQNSIKHAQAGLVEVLLHYEKNYLTIKLADNGKGFDTLKNKTTSKNGSGLLNIEKRIRLIKGQCQVSSQLGKGTTINIKIPLPEAISAPDN